jgi:hypothetical protein
MRLKSLMRQLLLLTFLLLAAVSFSQITIIHVGPDFKQGDFEGIYYTLPRTALKIDLEISNVIKIQGPFSQYADEYLGLQDVIERDLTTYQLNKISISTHSEPDPEQVYFVARSEKQSKEDKALLLSISRSGVFLGGELLKPVDERQVGMVTTDKQIDPDSLERYFRFLATNNLGIRIDTITRKITIDTTTIYQHSYKSRTVEKDDEEKAMDAVEQIELIRANRFNILTGYQEVPYSREAMEFMVEQLSLMEEEYLDLFRGKIIRQPITYSYVYIPGKNDKTEEWVPIFGLSERSGFQYLKDANDELFYLNFRPMGTTQFAGSEIAAEGKTLDGLSYRFPERTAISMKYKGRVYEVMTTEIAQFGTVSVMPSGTNKMSLHPATGAVKSVLIEY